MVRDKRRLARKSGISSLPGGNKLPLYTMILEIMLGAWTAFPPRSNETVPLPTGMVSGEPKVERKAITHR
jgi:hypothetical protein